MAMLFAGVELYDIVNARLLEKKCTQKTIGKVCENGWRSGGKGPSIDYFIAEFEVDDLAYKTEGMGTIAKGTEVTVWYDPKMPINSYAGDSPIKDSIVTVIGLLAGCIAIISIGVAMVRQYTRDRN